MPPVSAPQLPMNVNPAVMNILRARAQAGPQPAGVMPNSMNAPVTAPPQPQPVAPGTNMARPGTGTPAQQVMKAANQGQMSPLGQDPETRASAKDLIMKLMKHM